MSGFDTDQTSSASTSHSAPNWQMSQVDVSFWPVSAEPSPPGRDRKTKKNGKKQISATCKNVKII